MFKKAGLSILVVMMIAFTANISSASNALLYGGSEAANAFVSNNATSTAGVASSKDGAAYVGGSLSGAPATGLMPTALYVNAGGQGDALIYPYYNVNSNQANLFNIVNTADYGVRARIRFFEAKCSTELLDFDVCLSAHDVWTSAVVNVKGLATVIGLDSDTPIDYGDARGKNNGVLSALFPSGVGMRTGQAFTSNQGCTGTIAASDTLEGYFAVIGLNRLDEATTAISGSGTWPHACGKKGTSAGTWLNDNTVAETAPNVENLLMGYAAQIDLATGKTFEYNATSVANFNAAIWTTNPTDARPTLADFTSTTVEGTDLDFALTKNTLSTSYYQFSGTNGTEMIVNYPARKHTYTADVTTDDKFDDKRVAVTIFDDKEQTVVGGCTFSPCPGGSDVSLPNEVNILSFNTNAIFTSAVRQTVSTTYALGYVVLDLTTANTSTISPAHQTVATNAITGGLSFTSAGLPAIGLVAVDMGGGWNWMAPMAYTTSVTVR